MKVWKTVEFDRALVNQTAHEMGIPLAMAKILHGLGLKERDVINRFLNPRLQDLSDPFLIPEMDKAVERIWLALNRHEDIIVYGDYDVDGITSTSLLITILKKLGATRVTSCLPNRVSDGYGLSVDALTRCIESCEPDLLITVDCGTNAAEAARVIAGLGIDVVVTDHHESSGESPDVCALVNPTLRGNEESTMLAGVGVVFKLCHALIKYGRNHHYDSADEIDLRNYLEWVAVGTIADIVPLIGENRILVHRGLSQLDQTRFAGWKALIDIAGVRGPVNAYDVGFCLGPRLNAAGRMGKAESALELLLTNDYHKADLIAHELDAANRKRRDIEKMIYDEAISEIDSSFDVSGGFGIVVGREGWHPGVIGIVASKLVSVYQRPVVVIAFDEDGLGRGSCRSIEGYNLLNGLEQCKGALITFGGHKMAAGLKIDVKQLEFFRKRFNHVVTSELKDRDLRQVQYVNAWLELHQIDDVLMNAMERLGPFGRGNPSPVLAVRGVKIDAVRKVGKNHLRLTLSAGDARRPAIAFGMADRIIPESPVDAAFYLRRNSYMGRDSLQLNIQDVRASE